MDICSLISCTGCETRVCAKPVRSEVWRELMSLGSSSSFGLLRSWCAWQSLWCLCHHPEWSEALVQPGQLGELWVYLQVCISDLGEGSKPSGTCHHHHSVTLCSADALGSWCVWSISGHPSGLGAGKRWLKSRMWTHELCCAAEGITPQPARSGPIPAQRGLVGCTVQLECAPKVKEIIQREQLIGFAATRYKFYAFCVKK